MLIERRWCRAPAWISHLTCCAWRWHKSLCQMPAQDIGCTSKDKAPLGILNCKGNARMAEGERRGLGEPLQSLCCVWHVRGIFDFVSKNRLSRHESSTYVQHATAAAAVPPSAPPPSTGAPKKNGVQLAFRSHQLAFKPEHKSSARFTLHKMPKPLSMPMEMEMELELEMCEWRCEDSIVKCRHC